MKVEKNLRNVGQSLTTLPLDETAWELLMAVK